MVVHLVQIRFRYLLIQLLLVYAMKQIDIISRLHHDSRIFGINYQSIFLTLLVNIPYITKPLLLNNGSLSIGIFTICLCLNSNIVHKLFTNSPQSYYQYFASYLELRKALLVSIFKLPSKLICFSFLWHKIYALFTSYVNFF